MTDKLLKLTIVLLLSVSVVQAQNHIKLISKKTGQTIKSKPKIFLVLDITVHDSTMYEQYRIGVEPLIKKYGGKYLVRSGSKVFDNDPDTKLIPAEGNWAPDRLIITQWNSIEQFQKFIKSDEYQQIVKLRTNSSSIKSVIVKEYLKN